MNRNFSEIAIGRTRAGRDFFYKLGANVFSREIKVRYADPKKFTKRAPAVFNVVYEKVLFSAFSLHVQVVLSVSRPETNTDTVLRNA